MSRELWRNALHLAVLSAFGVAQPLFDLLGKTPEFFVVRGSRALDIVVFAVVLVVVPPLALGLLEWLVSLVSPRAARAAHLAFVAALAGLVALELVRRHAASTTLVFALAAAAGTAFAALYARTAAVRMFLTVLSPVPLLFVGLFLVRAPVLKLEGTAKALTIPKPLHDAPVVLVILDEFPVTSLMDARHEVDPVRFPHFAALARTSTWYRDATSVHEHTTEAVPAILTGLYPKPHQLPVAQDHPNNLFTLLGTRYRMNVFESVTQLCPERLCARRRAPFSSRMRALAKDLEVVYGHLVLPRRLERHLPSVSNTWQDFGGENHGNGAAPARNPLVVNGDKDIDRVVGRQMWQDQRFVWDRYVDGVHGDARPTLYMLHVLLPHYPWRFLPSGKQYGNSLGIDGLTIDTWTDDPWVVEQGWQRHLFQVGFTDRLLGDLVARLKRQGVWRRALVVVTADHGVSFLPGEHRRAITEGNLPDIASIPLFVKYPGETRGHVDDRHVQTIDIVPTIADVLGITLPYHADGTSLRHPAAIAQVTIRGRQGAFVHESAAVVARRKYQTLARQIRLFGTGDWRRVFAIGPHRELIGRAVAPLVSGATDATVAIDGESLFRRVDLRSALSPSHVTGRVSRGPLDLAIAVDGRIAAVTRTFAVDGDTHFAAFVPESAFRQGANSVDVYAVRGERLERLRDGAGADSRWSISGAALRDGAGHVVRVTPGALDGLVEDWYVEHSSVRFGGWAGDTKRKSLVDSVLVFSGDSFVYAGTTTVGRRGLYRLRADGSVVRAGFVFDLPRSLVGTGPGSPPLRFFAVRGGVATQLREPKGFPWRTS